ncbi:hypothetical protein [Flammeovirga pectinis]|nr:hypothetical protein [Flammeovirga pectinis]
MRQVKNHTKDIRMSSSLNEVEETKVEATTETNTEKKKKTEKAKK